MGQTIRCSLCHYPICGGSPILVFAVDQPELTAICHSTCQHSYSPLPGYARYKMAPPYHLSEREVSFLAHSYHKLFSLPGGFEPNRELRLCLAAFLRNRPFSLANAMASFHRFVDEHPRKYGKWLYEGDLELDFLRTLCEIQKAARRQPVGFEIYLGS
jgi:hypothetical protein